jgi:lipoate-protein ligase A
MKTKGVASIRSPVCNLRHWSPDLTHGSFVDAVVAEFKTQYGIDDEVNPFTSDILSNNNPLE